jgi:hypothetical protein
MTLVTVIVVWVRMLPVAVLAAARSCIPVISKSLLSPSCLATCVRSTGKTLPYLMCLSPKCYVVCTLCTHRVKHKARSQSHVPAAVLQRPAIAGDDYSGTELGTGRLNPVTAVRDPLPKIFVVFGTTIFARSSNADTCIFTCVPIATRWL